MGHHAREKWPPVSFALPPPSDKPAIAITLPDLKAPKMMGKNVAPKKNPSVALQQPKSAFFLQTKAKPLQAPDESNDVPARMVLSPEAGKSEGVR